MIIFHQIEVGGAPLTAVTDTFDITPSTPTHVSTATGGGLSNGDLVLIVVGGGGLLAICLSGLVVGVACCLIYRQKRKEDKVKRVSSKHSSVDQFPLHKVRRLIHGLCDV